MGETMATITYKNKKYASMAEETVLQTLLRNGINVPFSCKNGVCQACLMRSTDQHPPESSQKGLKQKLIDKNYFLTCKCNTQNDIDIALPKAADVVIQAYLVEKDLLNDDICRLKIESAKVIKYHAGQFINLHQPDGVIRSYSLASVPEEDPYLELHIKKVEGGAMSSWLHDSFNIGDEIEFHGPIGDAYFKPENENQDVLLISTGTGLAPHIGIVRDALLNEHKGAIHLYHGGLDEKGHYLREQLAILASTYQNFNYSLCADSVINSTHDVIEGQVSEIAYSNHKHLSECLLFLSGNPDMVNSAEIFALDSGVNKESIFSDPFEYSSQDEEVDFSKNRKMTAQEINKFKERDFPEPDPEMWAALDEGKLLTKILTSFYDRVFVDDLLSPYFVGVTKRRLIEKVYSFHYQMFTGEKVFFGERPRNSHNWMVIPDEIFDYREDLMMFCLRKHGLAEHLVKRWRDGEELYRSDIVKSKPVNKVLFGKEVPYEGFESLVMEFSSLCDSCQGEINVGDTIRYHVRMGTTYCPTCIKNDDESLSSDNVTSKQLAYSDD